MPVENQAQRTRTREDVDTRTCECCYETLTVSNFSTMHNVCEPCVEDNYSTCQGCNDQVHDDNVYYAVDSAYCEHCFYDYFTYCDSCGEATDREETIYVDDYPYCECCVPDSSEDLVERIENSTPPSNSIKCSTFNYKVKRLVGIEAECVYEYSDEFWTPTNWNNVSDGSISTDIEGYSTTELVSVPMSGDFIVDAVDKLIDWKKIFNADVNRSCGLHIHIDSTDMSAKEVARVGMVYNHFQEILKSMMPKSRQGSNWCKDFNMMLADLIGIDSEEQLVSLYYESMDSHPSTDKYNDARYSGLNLHSRYYHGSLEFRLHSGTLNKTKILNWISICNTIVEKGIELSKLTREDTHKWFSVSAEYKIKEVFGERLSSYMNKRVAKFMQ